MNKVLDWVFRILTGVVFLLAGLALGNNYPNAAQPGSNERILLVVVNHLGANGEPLSAWLIGHSPNKPTNLMLIYPNTMSSNSGLKSARPLNETAFINNFRVHQFLFWRWLDNDLLSFLNTQGFRWDHYLIIDHDLMGKIGAYTQANLDHLRLVHGAHDELNRADVSLWRSICGLGAQMSGGLVLNAVPHTAGHFISDTRIENLKLFPHTPSYSSCNANITGFSSIQIINPSSANP